MSSIVLDVPDELAAQLLPQQHRLRQVLELGLRQIDATPPGFAGAADVYEFLAGLPTPQEILAYRAVPALQARVSELLEKNRQANLSSEEEQEWRQYQYVEHLVRLAKTRAALKLRAPLRMRAFRRRCGSWSTNERTAPANTA